MQFGNSFKLDDSLGKGNTLRVEPDVLIEQAVEVGLSIKIGQSAS